MEAQPSPGPSLAADRAITAAVALEVGTVLLPGDVAAELLRPSRGPRCVQASRRGGGAGGAQRGGCAIRLARRETGSRRSGSRS